MRILRSLIQRLARDTRLEHGFTMVVTMGAVSMLLLAAAVSATVVDQDQPLAVDDRERKQAISAAEAGLQVYIHKLTVDSSFWAQCTSPADAVNDVWTGSNKSQDPRTWKNLPAVQSKNPDGSLNPAAVPGAYTIEVLPNATSAKCNSAKPDETVIDPDTATFRIRVTGAAVRDGARTNDRRALIATFKRKSFLDFIYFTDLEVMDPATYAPAGNAVTKEDSGRNPNPPYNQRDVVSWGNKACGTYAYVRGEGNKYRTDQTFYGQRRNSAGLWDGSRWNDWSKECSEIRFVTGDSIAGPLHSNDSLLLCGNPSFGRNPNDSIETSAPGTRVTDSYRQDPDCGTSSPDVNLPPSSAKANRGTWAYKQPTLDLPPTNASLKDEATENYSFAGTTKLTLTAAGILVRSGKLATGENVANRLLPYPDSGVVYVGERTDASQGALCSGEYVLSDPYTGRDGCGIAYVRGQYTSSLTIAASNDIVIDGNITKPADRTKLLGLIATDFIRIYHPTSPAVSCSSSSSSTDASGSLKDPTIEAALLTLQHSFIVDSYNCGDPLGNLTVLGSIAQKFRGPVGTGSRATSATGYIKKYTHDGALRYRTPPKFLDPVKAAWRVKTFQEQVPAY